MIIIIINSEVLKYYDEWTVFYTAKQPLVKDVEELEGKVAELRDFYGETLQSMTSAARARNAISRLATI